MFVLCCKDTTKSNNYQIFKEKSYYIVYYLTFLNRKIKYCYLFTYYLLCYCYYILYVSYCIIYLIIYRERTKANGKGRAATSSASGRCHRHTLPPPRHRSTATSSDRAAPRAVGHPARLGPVPSVRW